MVEPGMAELMLCGCQLSVLPAPREDFTSNCPCIKVGPRDRFWPLEGPEEGLTVTFLAWPLKYVA